MRRCKTHNCEWGECSVTLRYLSGECELDKPWHCLTHDRPDGKCGVIGWHEVIPGVAK